MVTIEELGIGSYCNIDLEMNGQRLNCTFPIAADLLCKSTSPFFPKSVTQFLCDRPGFHEIPRVEAIVVDAPAFFSLCKGRKRHNDTAFGDASIFFRPPWLRRKLQNEIAELKRLSEWLIEFLDKGMPDEW